MTTTELFAKIVEAAPLFAAIVDEHLVANGELLPHVLMGDCGRFIASYFDGNNAAFAEAPSEIELRQVLSVLETAMVDGNDATQNVVAVSFLECVWLQPHHGALQPLLGPALRAEIQRQKDWSNP